jgi:hypothetical protein
MQQSYRSTTFQLRRAKDRRAFNGETQVNPPVRAEVSFTPHSSQEPRWPCQHIFLPPLPSPSRTFLVADYHVHLSPQLSIEQAVKLGKDRQVGIGILEHPGPGYKIQNDEDLTQYLYPAWAARAASSVAALS